MPAKSLNRSPRVSLLVRVTINGKRKFIAPALTKTGIPRPGFVVLDEQIVAHPHGHYVLRFQEGNARKWEPVGNDPQMALTSKRQRELLLKQETLFPKPVAPPKIKAPTMRSMEQLSAQWIAEAAVRKSTRTAYIYGKTMGEFRASCTKQHVEKIDREDVTAFLRSMQERGKSPRTLFNAASYLRSFFRWAGLPNVIAGRDLPRFTEKAVTSYSTEEVKAMLAAADPEERLLLQFLVGTGFREQEVMYSYFSDIDFARQTITVKEKLEHGFRVKDRGERMIPLSDSITSALQSRLEARPNQRLIFPAPSTGEPDGHLLRRIKVLYLKAGLNCGHCVSKGGKRCDEHPVCRKAELHKTRKTFATMLSESGVSVQTISKMLGHADLETTIRCLQSADLHSERTRSQMNRTFPAWISERESRAVLPLLSGQRAGRRVK